MTSFLLSHIGLLSLVVGYCIMGAFIFQELERANEIETKREMRTKRLAMTDTLWDITKYHAFNKSVDENQLIKILIKGAWRCSTRRTGPRR